MAARSKVTAGKRADVMQQLTDLFIQEIESGMANPHGWVAPWRKLGADWARNAETGKAYRGINQMVLGSYSAVWATYRQWATLGCVPRKGVHATPGVRWIVPKEGDEAEPAEDGKAKRKRGMFPVGFSVFSVDQVVRLPGSRVRMRGNCQRPIVVEDAVTRVKARFAPPELTPLQLHEAAKLADNTLEVARKTLGVKLEHGGDSAHFNRATDTVTLPKLDAFDTHTDYVSTKGHELIHSTGVEKRQARPDYLAYHQDRQARAREELVAEMGAAGLMRLLGVCDTPRPDHAQYLASWLGALRDDKWALNRASKLADLAIGMLAEAAGISEDRDGQAAPEARVYEPESPAEPVVAPVEAKPVRKRTRKPVSV